MTKDNQETIEDCLESLIPLNAKILICDLGSKDKTLDRCLKYKTEILSLSLNDDISQARNHVIKNCNSFWHMVIEPWEKVLQNQEEINNLILQAPESYSFQIIQGDIVTKETRLWHLSKNLKFENPIFENIKASSKQTETYIFSHGGKRNININDLLDKWQLNSPLSPEPYYYRACNELIQKNWNTFLNYADIFLHQQKSQDMSYFMTCYYVSMVLCYIKKDYGKAIQVLSPCILKNPTLAEFWCLLADIYYAIGDYKKSLCFYDNAKILGSRRLNSCDFPMEISKYKEYPEKMINACNSLINNLNVYGLRTNK